MTTHSPNVISSGGLLRSVTNRGALRQVTSEGAQTSGETLGGLHATGLAWVPTGAGLMRPLLLLQLLQLPLLLLLRAQQSCQALALAPRLLLGCWALSVGLCASFPGCQRVL
jgi:hypothetical protein